MPKIIKHRFKLYRRFETDIWGKFTVNPAFNHTMVKYFQDLEKYKTEKIKRRGKKFVYRIDVANPDRIFKRKKWKFFSMNLLKFFYWGIKQKPIFYLIQRAHSKPGFWVNYFLWILESRISTFLYRINWVPNVLFMNQFLRSGEVVVNRGSVYNINERINLFDIVELRPTSSETIKKDLFIRIETGAVWFNTPRYIFLNSKFMFAFAYKFPEVNDLAFPVFLDLQRIGDVN